jgi:hypothetical protein
LATRTTKSFYAVSARIGLAKLRNVHDKLFLFWTAKLRKCGVTRAPESREAAKNFARATVYELAKNWDVVIISSLVFKATQRSAKK